MDDTVSEVWGRIAAWTERHVLHLGQEISTELTGSGDRTADYIQLLCMATLAIAIALSWTIIDRTRRRDTRLVAWLRIYLRYYLAVVLIVYGLFKVFRTQFPFPDALDLQETYGESSPMHLLWTFMGYSKAYCAFAGGAEVVAGALLLFRRTVTLGALSAVAVMSNVVMLNYCYDVPVKQFSSHLLLMAAVLAAPDAGRLMRMLVLNRPTEAVQLREPAMSRGLERARGIVKAAFVTACLGSLVYRQYGHWREFGDNMSAPSLFGVYEVEAFARGGQRIESCDAASSWIKVTSGYGQGFDISRADGTTYRFGGRYTTWAPLILLKPRQGAGTFAAMTYARPDADHLVVRGYLGDGEVEATLRRIDPTKALLVTRRFHWISEYPFNR